MKKKNIPPLIQAIIDGAPAKEVRQHLKSCKNVNERGSRRTTALHHAAMKNREDLAKMLLDAGANPRIRDADGFAPLSLAAKHDAHRVIEPLLDGGLDINEKDAIGFTAMHIAAVGNKMAVVRKLLKFGADLNAQDSEGNTPLHMAIIHGASFEKLLFLSGSGARLDIPNNGNQTPMDLYFQMRSSYDRDLKEISVTKH